MTKSKQPRIGKKIMLLDVIEDRTTAIGNGCHIILPASWIGKKVLVLKLDK
jgi:putative transposon-encoded protein